MHRTYIFTRAHSVTGSAIVTLPEPAVAARARKNVMTFTDLGIKNLNARKHLDEVNAERRERGLSPVSQDVIWDKAQKGLALLISARAKTFRVQFKWDGVYVSAKIGRFGEMPVIQADRNKENSQVRKARDIAVEWRALAAQGIDPRKQGEAERDQAKRTFEAVVDEFIKHYAKPRQRTWDQTERVLKKNCKRFLKKPIADITKQDVRGLLRAFIADGHVYKASVTYAWLKKLWRWAAGEDLVTTPIMEAVSIHYEKRERDRYYSDDEIKAVWQAANQLDAIESAYVKLLVLLAPRKTALACLERKHLDDANNPTLWTTPFELTKSRKSSLKKRIYLIPLPPLAQRILKGLPKSSGERLFPGLPVHQTKAGRPTFYGIYLQGKLIERGAPADFDYHGWRHTITTWLENRGHSEWERGLVLNHSGGGSVTGDYSHGYPLELKRTLLAKWADHVERLVQPEGVAVMR